MTGERIKQIINEELTKTEAEKLFNDKLEKEYKGKKFEDATRTVVADVLDDFFKNLWAKNNFWKSFIKR